MMRLCKSDGFKVVGQRNQTKGLNLRPTDIELVDMRVAEAARSVQNHRAPPSVGFAPTTKERLGGYAFAC